jgi:hypothetical protein
MHAAPGKMEQEIRRWINQLGSKRFQEREQAARVITPGFVGVGKSEGSRQKLRCGGPPPGTAVG